LVNHLPSDTLPAPLDYQDIPRTVGERDTLLSFLRWQRDTLARKCAGLKPEQLRRRAAAPSTLCLLGLVRHLTDVERGWFIRTLDGQDVRDLYSTESNPEGDFNDVDSADPQEALAAWRSEIERADQVIARHDLDDEVSQHTGRRVRMRWILLHMVEEYSRHNGHADLLRERIDGATGY
jgi:uncharacterized damage-inducible protein DinB